MSNGEVSTIFVAGMPFDAQPRELENTVRFFSGYEGVKISGPKGGGKGGAAMFVKFDTPDNAAAAMKVLNNQPFDLQYPTDVMRVEIARSDMKSPVSTVPRQHHVPAQVYQPPPPRHAPPPMAVYHHAPVYMPGPSSHHEPARKRQRVGQEPGQVDTVAVFGAIEKGYTESQLEDFFNQMPGFVAFKVNKKVGGGFVKYSSPALAHEALEVALDNGLEAHMAKTSMSSPDGGGGGHKDSYDHYDDSYKPPPPREPHPYHGGSGYGDRDRGPPPRSSSGGGGGRRGGGGDVDTLILQGVFEKGWSSEQLQDFFADLPGFTAFKANNRIGGGFVKFADKQLAADAIEEASKAGIEAQMARSSMNA